MKYKVVLTQSSGKEETFLLGSEDLFGIWIEKWAEELKTSSMCPISSRYHFIYNGVSIKEKDTPKKLKMKARGPNRVDVVKACS